LWRLRALSLLDPPQYGSGLATNIRSLSCHIGALARQAKPPLIPGDSFCEYQTPSRADVDMVAPGEDHPLFDLSGLWLSWRGIPERYSRGRAAAVRLSQRYCPFSSKSVSVILAPAECDRWQRVVA
jgi:putative SOS response-associated peptidase YedK